MNDASLLAVKKTYRVDAALGFTVLSWLGSVDGRILQGSSSISI